ncbi:MAG: AAA family ATPase, partial [Candidatus Binatia bacterium]
AVQPSGVRSRLDIAAGRLTRFVGREVELATLVDRWERAQDGEGQTAVVLGEAGVGKSRLVYQLRERLAAVPHTWLECGATPYTEGTPFHPVIALLAQGLAFAPEDTAAETLGKLERGLGALASAETVALLADFLGLPPPTPLPMSPELQRRKTIELLAQWTLAMSAVQPLVVLVEDLHWCDASSLELLGRLVEQSPTARVLLLATARPEFTPPWPARSNLTTLHLARLTKRQASEMVATLVGTELPAATLDALVARADGVPLYVEELTKSVVEPGTTRSAEAIPATLADSLMARLDRLSTAKEVAQRAAVLGREFAYPLLAAVAGLKEAALRHGLARLVEAEIVFGRGEPPAATYTFKHALVQEAAYESLLKRTRQQLHGRVVDALVAAFPERAAAEPEVVARHAVAAGRIDDAITYYQRAGEHAQARSAHGEAITQFQRAIAQLASQPESHERDKREVALQLALGASLVAARGFAHAETETAYERARALAEGGGDATHLALTRIGLSVLYISRGDPERGRALAVEVLAQAEARSNTEEALSGHTQVAAAKLYQGQFASSLAHAERALTLYDPERHRDLVRVFGTDQSVAALSYTACSLWALGQPAAALSRAEQAVGLAQRLDHPFSLAFALSFAASIDWWRGDGGRQRARGAGVIALSEAQGFPLWLGIGHAWQGAARVAAGDTAALAEILDGLALAGETGTQASAPLLFGLLAEAQQTVGQLIDARGTVASGLAVAAHTGQPFHDAELHRLDGDLLLATGGAPADAEGLFHRALDIARAQQAKFLALRAATSLARLWRDQGKHAAARDILAPLYAWFTEGFDTRDLKDAKALLDDLA